MRASRRGDFIVHYLVIIILLPTMCICSNSHTYYISTFKFFLLLQQNTNCSSLKVSYEVAPLHGIFFAYGLEMIIIIIKWVTILLMRDIDAAEYGICRGDDYLSHYYYHCYYVVCRYLLLSLLWSLRGTNESRFVALDSQRGEKNELVLVFFPLSRE